VCAPDHHKKCFSAIRRLISLKNEEASLAFIMSAGAVHQSLTFPAALFFSDTAIFIILPAVITI